MRQLRHKHGIPKPESGTAHVKRSRPQPLSTARCRLSGTFFFCPGDVIVCLIWQCVYAGGVGAIVCLWRLEMHSRVPGECHCRSLPQLAIVRPGVVTGWVSFPMWLILPVKMPLPAPKSGKGSGGPRTTAPLCLVLSSLPHGLRPFLLGKCLDVSSGVPVA